jgi:hypothetical protein
MKQDPLAQHLQSYRAWHHDLIKAMESYRAWLEDHEMASPEQEFRIFETIDALRKDRLTVAFVAEFSRGKTELINALFFSHYGRRLLPSEAGRTTMCPTELFYDTDSDSAYIHLLPIETRLQDQSIADLRHEPIHWSQTPLHVEDPAHVAKTLHEVIRTKQVPVERAREMGLYDQNSDPYFLAHGKTPSQVEVPVWRHALISFPHVLLKQGLVVLDTPGLNAMGNEPELTLNMLPAAQAVIFLLGADTGVTRSDMEMWEHHVRPVRNSSDRNLLVVLNKIDTLWDELKEAAGVEASIESQRRSTAEQLQVDPERVFTVSAQKGLIAKVREDAQLLDRSRLPTLEAFLADTVLPGKRDIVRETVVARIGGMTGESVLLLENRVQEADRQLAELRSLRGKNADVIMHLMNKSREEQAAYLRNVESFQNSRRLLQNQARSMVETLSMDGLDHLIGKTRETMSNSWTTAGMKRGMETFFNGARDTMGQVSAQAEQTRTLIRAIYRKFHEEHGLPQLTPKQFTTSGYSAELERLYQDAEAFRRNPLTTMTEQSFVVKKFFISLVSRTRNLFFKANRDADIWLKEVMNPLVDQIREHKTTMEKRLETLRRISESRDTLDSRILELDAQLRETHRQLETLYQIRKSLETEPQHPRPAADEVVTDRLEEETAV